MIPNVRNHTKEFKQGQKDYHLGKAITENPYKSATYHQYNLWLDGFKFEMFADKFQKEN